MAYDKKYSAEDQQVKVKEITDQLEAGLKALFEGDNYRQYLNTMSKFHNYSFNNTLLIALQKPDATYVAGIKSWNRHFGRSVNKGETGIKIFAPAPYKVKKEEEEIDKETGLPVLDKDGNPVIKEVEITIPAFKVVSVFDVSQTNGRALPTIGVEELNGDVKDYEKLLSVLREISPVPIKFEEINTGSHGFYHQVNKDITIKEGMSEVQTVKTAIHEIAHAMLHDRDLSDAQQKNKNTREVEAESIAYTVCQHFGLDTSDYSFGYIAGWGTNTELTELKASLETIRQTASQIISSIEEKYLGIEKENVQDKSAEVGGEVVPKAAEKPKNNNIIGNTDYKDIKDKQYVKAPASLTQYVEEFLKAENIPYSGLKGKAGTTFTVSKENFTELQNFVDDMKLSQKVINENKSKNDRVSKSEIERAEIVNLPQFLMSQGVELKRVGKEYIMKEHDSVHIYDNTYGEKGKWFRFSENVGGGNIDFCEKFLGMSFKEAVEALNGGRDISYEPPQRNTAEVSKPPEKHEINIKENADSKRAIAYLTKTRGIDYNIVAELLKSGKLVQEEKTGNAVFLIKDENNVTVGAEKIGTSTENRFKGIEAGTAEGYGFEIVRGKGENAYFFESAVDMLSFMQLNSDKLDNARLVSMMGVKPSIVEAVMQRNNILSENVRICSDNDKAGNKFAKSLQEKYPQMKRLIPPDLKDWNDQLRYGDRQIEFAIYQLKDGVKYHGVRFADYETNKDKNLNSEDYNLVYKGNWKEIEGMSSEAKLNSIFKKFNIDLPSDYMGHSLSVSDVVTVGCPEDNGSYTAHYVDPVGFADMSEFFKEHTAELQKSAPQNSNNGVIGNIPYKDIEDKLFMKMSADEAKQAAEKLDKAGIKFSGRIIGDRATLTINKSDEQLYKNAMETVQQEDIKPKYNGVLPDDSVSVEDMEKFGYEFSENEMLPLSKEKAAELFDNGAAIFKLYPDNTEGQIENRSEIENPQGCMFGIERSEFEELSTKLEQVKDNAEKGRDIPVILYSSDRRASLSPEEAKAFKESFKENEACAKELIASSKENITYGDMAGVTYFDAEKTIEDILNKGFSAERVGWIVASQVVDGQICLDNPKLIDGRFSNKVKEWALNLFSQQEKYPDRCFQGCDMTSALHRTYVNSLAEAFIERQLELSRANEQSQTTDLSSADNSPTVSEIEAKMNSGETVSLYELSKAIAKEKTEQPPKTKAPKAKQTAKSSENKEEDRPSVIKQIENIKKNSVQQSVNGQENTKGVDLS